MNDSTTRQDERISDHETSAFIREEIIDDIFRALKRSDSVRLAGVPHIGITSIMKRIDDKCRPGGDWGDKYFSFYISSHYDLNSVASQINDRLESNKLSRLPANLNQFVDLCEKAASICRKELADKRQVNIDTVFLLDDFHKNFQAYNKDDVNTLLSVNAMKDIKKIIERKREIYFIVSYTHPYDPLLNTDWYLNNLYSIYVEMLTEQEADNLVRIRRINNGLPIDADSLNKIAFYCGRHPELLNRAAITDFSNKRDERALLDWLKKRHDSIYRYIMDNDSHPEKPSIEILKRTARIQDADKPDNELVKGYCYTEEKDGKLIYRIFSKYFAEYLSKIPVRTRIHDLLSLLNKVNPTRLTTGLSVALIGIALPFIPLVRSWQWLSSHPNRLPITIIVPLIFLTVSISIITSSRKVRNYCLGNVALGIFFVLLQVLGT